MIKSKEFTAFGRKYRTRQFPASQGYAIFRAGLDDVDPLQMLSYTDAWHEKDNRWYGLINSECLNLLVFDQANAIPPVAVLRGVMTLIYEFNFKFLETWKGVKVPSRFQEGDGSIASAAVEPMLASLIQNDVASLRELEEYYSLQDAFIMFDVITAKMVNESLAYETASKNSGRK